MRDDDRPQSNIGRRRVVNLEVVVDNDLPIESLVGLTLTRVEGSISPDVDREWLYMLTIEGRLPV